MLAKGTLLWSATSVFLYAKIKTKTKSFSMQFLLRDSTVYKNTWQPREHKHDSWKLFCRICVFVCEKQKQIIVHLKSSEEPHPLKHTDTSNQPHASASHFLSLWSAVFKHSASLSSLINYIIIPKPAAVDIFNNKHRTEQKSTFRKLSSWESVWCVFGQAFVWKLFTAADKPGRIGGRNENNDWNPRVFPELACRHERLIALQSSRYSGQDHTLGMNYLTRFVFMSGCDPNHTAYQMSACNAAKRVSITDAK